MNGFQVKDVVHSVLWYHKDHYAGHPIRGGLWNLGDGELAVAHPNAYRPYRRREDTSHDYMLAGKVLLQRSFDSGETWPKGQETVIWDSSATVKEHRAWLFGAPGDRQELDMTQPRSIFHFGRVHAGDDKQGTPDATQRVRPPSPVHFSLRSTDGGRTWENRPTVIAPPLHCGENIVSNYPMVQYRNGVIAMAASADNEACMYVTDNHGLTWDYVQTIAAAPLGISRYTYCSLLQFKSGRLMCLMLRMNVDMGVSTSIGNWPCVCFSDDDGMSWSRPRAIIRPGQSPWPAHRKPLQFDRPAPTSSRPEAAPSFTPRASGKAMYRSPYPVLLGDGRIVVILARRKPPAGMSCVVSEDEGQTWLPEVVLRADASDEGDLGYPVATELDDGRVFTAYYYCNEPELPFGGPRYIAGTHFRVD